jgi:hypothetical protein
MPSIGSVFAFLFFLSIVVFSVLTFTNILCNDVTGVCFRKAQPIGKEGACATCVACPVTPAGPSST